LNDVLNHLTNLVHYSSADELLAQYQYTVASDGQRQAAMETRRESDGGYSTNWLVWSYDGLQRLTNEMCCSTVSALNCSNHFIYDLAGNRKTNWFGPLIFN
jgi:hypothetical protein